jgi:hypothetical protein
MSLSTSSSVYVSDCTQYNFSSLRETVKQQGLVRPGKKGNRECENRCDHYDEMVGQWWVRCSLGVSKMMTMTVHHESDVWSDLFLVQKVPVEKRKTERNDHMMHGMRCWWCVSSSTSHITSDLTKISQTSVSWTTLVETLLLWFHKEKLPVFPVG